MEGSQKTPAFRLDPEMVLARGAHLIRTDPDLQPIIGSVPLDAADPLGRSFLLQLRAIAMSLIRSSDSEMKSDGEAMLNHLNEAEITLNRLGGSYSAAQMKICTIEKKMNEISLFSKKKSIFPPRS